MSRVIMTARLELRSFVGEDADAAHRIYGDSEVMRFVGRGEPAADVGATLAMVDAYIKHERVHGFSFYAVIERESGALVGDAGLYRVDPNRSEVELGYTLAREWWGRGFTTEAARACLQLAFERFGLDEVVALTVPENGASVRVLEKLGMQRVGSRLAYGREHVMFRLGRERYEERAASG
jgi:RimJ/RimL family protein N-acetyltransferase